MYFTAYNLWTFSWFVHFELLFRLKGTEKIHTERFFLFLSIYSILYGFVANKTFLKKRKFSFLFRKLLCEILHFFAKWMKRKMRKYMLNCCILSFMMKFGICSLNFSISYFAFFRDTDWSEILQKKTKRTCQIIRWDV